MPTALRPFTIGTALWAVALVLVMLGVEVPGADRDLVIATCVAGLILGGLGYWYLWPRARDTRPQE